MADACQLEAGERSGEFRLLRKKCTTSKNPRGKETHRFFSGTVRAAHPYRNATSKPYACASERSQHGQSPPTLQRGAIAFAAGPGGRGRRVALSPGPGTTLAGAQLARGGGRNRPDYARRRLVVFRGGSSPKPERNGRGSRPPPGDDHRPQTAADSASGPALSPGLRPGRGCGPFRRGGDRLRRRKNQGILCSERLPGMSPSPIPETSGVHCNMLFFQFDSDVPAGGAVFIGRNRSTTRRRTKRSGSGARGQGLIRDPQTL